MGLLRFSSHVPARAYLKIRNLSLNLLVHRAINGTFSHFSKRSFPPPSYGLSGWPIERKVREWDHGAENNSRLYTRLDDARKLLQNSVRCPEPARRSTRPVSPTSPLCRSTVYLKAIWSSG